MVVACKSYHNPPSDAITMWEGAAIHFTKTSIIEIFYFMNNSPNAKLTIA
jgi:hypothetical protein